MFDPQSDETTGYHLFFEPTGGLAVELQEVISRIADACKGPVFSPHVTLLARIPGDDESVLLEKASRLSAMIAPVTLTLGNVQREPTYFRALYYSIVEQEVMRANHAKAAELFSMEVSEKYTAHLSLLYGNYSDEQKSLIGSSVALSHKPSFLADTLHLYKTHGRAEDWYKIQEFPLVG